MQTDKQRASVQQLNSKVAQELRALLDRTGLLAALRAELFTQWMASPQTHWPQIEAQLGVLNTADIVLKRMEQADG